MVFFIPYILFEVPSNIFIRKIAPSTWLSSIMVLWGIECIFSFDDKFLTPVPQAL